MVAKKKDKKLTKDQQIKQLKKELKEAREDYGRLLDANNRSSRLASEKQVLLVNRDKRIASLEEKLDAERSQKDAIKTAVRTYLAMKDPCNIEKSDCSCGVSHTKSSRNPNPPEDVLFARHIELLVRYKASISSSIEESMF